MSQQMDIDQKDNTKIHEFSAAASVSSSSRPSPVTTSDLRKQADVKQVARDKGGIVDEKWWMPRGFDMANSGWTTLENKEEDSYRSGREHKTIKKTKGLNCEESPER